MIDSNKLQKELFDHKVYSAWQFIVYTEKNIEALILCLDIIKAIVAKTSDDSENWYSQPWEEKGIDNIDEAGHKQRQLAVKAEDLPSLDLEILGIPVSSSFYFEMKIRDFFQYAMNTFDSISQVANTALLANKAKKVDSVDFQQMSRTFEKQSYSSDFPLTSAWFKKVKSAGYFEYVEAVNNRTKHTGEIPTRLAINLLGGGCSEASLGSFFRKQVEHPKSSDLITKLMDIYDFIESSWLDFMNVMESEVKLDRYVENRIHTIDGAYCQKIGDDPKQWLSIPYNIENDFQALPDNFQLLLAMDNNGKIESLTPPFDQLYICAEAPNGNNSLKILGRYVAENTIGEDSLVRYRTFCKDSKTSGDLCLLEAMEQEKKMAYIFKYFEHCH